MPEPETQIWKGSAFCIDRLPGKDPRTVIFRFTGPFTARDMFSSVAPTAFHHIFDCEIPSGDAEPTTNIFDLTAVPYMDSSGIGMLVSHYVRCRGKGVRLIAAGANPRVAQLFKLTKVDTFISMAATVDEAESI
jgi:ABC-type transporter Mla MlaB component